MFSKLILQRIYLIVFAFAAFIIACDRSDQQTYQPVIDATAIQKSGHYIIGIHPLHNPHRLVQVYGPIVEYINRHIPQAEFKLEASRNYEEFERKLYAGHFAFAMPNPYQTLQSLKYDYHIFGKMSDDEVFRGIILVRKDSGINTVTDLKGKAVSYPSATALAATMMPQYYLHTHGININKDIENRYVGSQESSIENVLRGHVAAGATWPVPWTSYSAKHPDKAAQLVVRWETAPLLNNGWVARNNVPPDIQEKVAQLLFNLQNHAEGQAMLRQVPISKFEPATDKTYQPVHDFLENFSKEVREVAH